MGTADRRPNAGLGVSLVTIAYRLYGIAPNIQCNASGIPGGMIFMPERGKLGEDCLHLVIGKALAEAIALPWRCRERHDHQTELPISTEFWNAACGYAANPSAMAKVHGPVALVHGDAHADINDEMFGEKIAHRTPFRRTVEEGPLVWPT